MAKAIFEVVCRVEMDEDDPAVRCAVLEPGLATDLLFEKIMETAATDATIRIVQASDGVRNSFKKAEYDLPE